MGSNYIELLDPNNEHLKLTQDQTKERIRLNPSRYFYIDILGSLTTVSHEDVVYSKTIWEKSGCFYQAIIDTGHNSDIDYLIEIASRDKKRYEKAEKKAEKDLVLKKNSFSARIASNVSPMEIPRKALYEQDGTWRYTTTTSEAVGGGSDLGIDNDLLMLL